MAWPDGSRFLVASGVKWGNGPKVYKGSSKDTEWNKDLLWKLYVEGEARKTGIHLPKNAADVDAMPPFMKPLAAALDKHHKNVPFKDPFRGDPAKTCQDKHEDSPLRQLRKLITFPDLAAEQGPPRRRERSDMSEAGTPTSSARRAHAAAAAAHLGRSKSSARGIALASSRSRSAASLRGSARRPASSRSNTAATTSARLKRIEEALMEERAARQSLTATLDKERRQREAVEGKLQNMQASLRKQQQRAAKMEKYEQIMGTLMNSLREADRKARRS